MAFPATDMGLQDVSFRFFTMGRNLDAALESGRERSGNRRSQPEILTRVCAHDPRYGAGLAQIARPALACRFEQTAFLHIAAAKVISIEVRAFGARRCSHSFIIDLEYQQIISEQLIYPKPLARQKANVGQAFAKDPLRNLRALLLLLCGVCKGCFAKTRLTKH